jgi:hypothetical protein
MRCAYQKSAKRTRHVLRTRGIHFVHQAFASLTSSLMFFVQHPCWAIYFFPTTAKSKQKGPRSSNALLPILSELSRPFLAVPDGEKLNWLSLPIDLLN